MQATVTIEYNNKQTAEAIVKAVSPDNFMVPSCLQIKTVGKGKKVITEMNCKGKLATFTATIDDLLFSVSTAEKALKSIENSKT